MSKLKLAVFAGSAAAVVAISILAAQAVNPLAVTCAGNVSGTQIMWTATSTGGNAPVALLWSGDSKVAGSASAAITGTYTVNGTYTAMIQATDASSSIATSTCMATVTANVVPTATSTLNVLVTVNNTAGGSATPSSFTAMVSGAAATPSSFMGSASGTAVMVNASATYMVSASSLANYTASMSGNCAGPIAAGAVATCTLTETFVASTPTSTPPAKFMPPMLNINPSGHFKARGMIVTSVASGSFQGVIWGITYTVNWTGHMPEFLSRDGEEDSMTTSPSAQLNVGDEVGVSGKIDPSAPFIVNADVVRDYTIIKARPKHDDQEGNSNGQGNNGNGRGGDNEGNGTSSTDGQSRLNDLLNQLHNLQNLFKGHGGGNGNDQ